MDPENHRKYLHHVTLHCAERDTLLARQRLERALAAVDWAPTGLPLHAMLLVRRLVAASRKDVALEAGVSQALREQAHAARRPWVQADAAVANAVWFADDSELATCLVLDWLHGVLLERWWWRSVLAGASVSEWVRRHVLAQGDRVAPVIAHLSHRGEALNWLTRLHDDEAELGLTSISQAFALPLAAPAAGAYAATRESLPSVDAARVPRRVEHQSPAASASIARLLTQVPELHHARHLRPAATRLLAWALVAARDPGWLRTADAALAVESWVEAAELQRAATDAGERMPRAEQPPRGKRPAEGLSGEVGSIPWTAVAPNARRAARTEPAREMPAPPRLGDGSRSSVGKPPSTAAPLMAQPVATGSRAPAGSIGDAAQPASPTWGQPSPPDVSWPAQTSPYSTVSAGSVDEARLSVPAPAATDFEARYATRSVPPVGDEPPAILLARTVRTRFGGLFYLLNAALALGLYGDFTSPRKPGIALSPWDWLALVGRSWFGAELERDAVWPLLGDLAGRRAGEATGQAFEAPQVWTVSDDWLAPWGEVATVSYGSTRSRLRLWHPAGFALFDGPRDPLRTPFAQARLLCAGSARLVPARLQRGAPNAGVTAGCHGTARWMSWLLPYLNARLARALGRDSALTEVVALVCRHDAELRCSVARLDVRLSLATLPLPIRLAGLDRDPGWIPAAGRAVAFHFD